MKTLLLSALRKETHTKYRTAIKGALRSDEAKDILSCIDVLQDESEQDLTLNDLVLGLKRCYPEKKAAILCKFVELWDEAQFNPKLVESYLDEEVKRSKAYDIAVTGVAVFEGRESYDKLLDLAGGLGTARNTVDFEFVPDTISELQAAKVAKGGFQWRLKALNTLLGHLPGKTLGIIFARPEAGKTSFLCSEVSYMALQTDKPILVVSNEEDPANVKIRYFQAAFNVTEAELFASHEKYQKQWDARIGNRLFISGDVGLSSRAGIESALNTLQPGLLVVDQADKVTGFKADRHDLEKGQIYQWLRRMANKHNIPVIAVTQAGSSAENKKWLRFSDMMDSHTSKVAEADWVLGIGKAHDSETARYLHTSKDKLPLSEGKDPAKRHGYTEVILDQERARFLDCGA